MGKRAMILWFILTLFNLGITWAGVSLAQGPSVKMYLLHDGERLTIHCLAEATPVGIIVKPTKESSPVVLPMIIKE